MNEEIMIMTIALAILLPVFGGTALVLILRRHPTREHKERFPIGKKVSYDGDTWFITDNHAEWWPDRNGLRLRRISRSERIYTRNPPNENWDLVKIIDD